MIIGSSYRLRFISDLRLLQSRFNNGFEETRGSIQPGLRFIGEALNGPGVARQPLIFAAWPLLRFIVDSYQNLISMDSTTHDLPSYFDFITRDNISYVSTSRCLLLGFGRPQDKTMVVELFFPLIESLWEEVKGTSTIEDVKVSDSNFTLHIKRCRGEVNSIRDLFFIESLPLAKLISNGSSASLMSLLRL